MNRVLLCPDSFKGTYRADEVADAVAAGLQQSGAEAVCMPMADGGEGTLDALGGPLGLEIVEIEAVNPWGGPTTGRYGCGGGLAVVETAAVDGLGCANDGDRDPVTAGTYGTGLLIADAVHRGATHIVVAAGGSATSDGGMGAVRAVRDRGGLAGARITVLTDVRTDYADAAAVFGPQKGANPAQVAKLTARLHRIAASLPRDPRGVPGTGAAGGLSGGLWAAFDAELLSGADFVLDTLGFDAEVARCDAVVVGEGRLDSQTVTGKAIARVLARRGRARAFAVVGSVTDDADTTAFDEVIVASDATAMHRAGERIAFALRDRRSAMN